MEDDPDGLKVGEEARWVGGKRSIEFRDSAPKSILDCMKMTLNDDDSIRMICVSGIKNTKF